MTAPCRIASPEPGWSRNNGLTAILPQLTGANTVEATPDGWLFEHDCRDMGKRKYENTGPLPIAIGLRVMTAARFGAGALRQPISLPLGSAVFLAQINGNLGIFALVDVIERFGHPQVEDFHGRSLVDDRPVVAGLAACLAEFRRRLGGG